MTSELAAVTVTAGMPTPQAGDSTGVLPSTTTNFVKLLQEQGFEVSVAVLKQDRKYVDLNSAEIWLPVLLFGVQPVWDLTVISLVGAIKSFYARRRVAGNEDVNLPPGILNLQCSFEEADGSRREFDAHGPASEVIESLKMLGKNE